MLLVLASAFWGFAEATLFFVVPDVLLSAIALRDQLTAVRASFAAVLAAMIGGPSTSCSGPDCQSCDGGRSISDTVIDSNCLT